LGGPAQRRRVVGALMAVPALGLGRVCRAGAQVDEPLADSVRTVLAAQIADRRPPERHFATVEERLGFVRWLDEMSARLASRSPEYRIRLDLLRTLDYECGRAALDRQLVLGLIEVESNFRKYAISVSGARGYMQVMPFWTHQIGDGNERSLFEMPTNLRFGCVILRFYIDREQGDLFRALGRYNGSLGRPEYPNAVLASRNAHWTYPTVA
jgi:soluble lytic murein transglycosylase-like protein